MHIWLARGQAGHENSAAPSARHLEPGRHHARCTGCATGRRLRRASRSTRRHGDGRSGRRRDEGAGGGPAQSAGPRNNCVAGVRLRGSRVPERTVAAGARISWTRTNQLDCVLAPPEVLAPTSTTIVDALLVHMATKRIMMARRGPRTETCEMAG